MKENLDKMNLYHEDGGSGLSQIGDFVYSLIRFFAILLAIGVFFALSWTYLVEDPFYIWLGLGIYGFIAIMLLLAIFLDPLNSIRKIIIEEKTSRKAKISRTYQQIDEMLLVENVDTKNTDELKERLEIIESFERIINRIPNWPFNIGQIIKASIAISTPIFTILLGILIDFLIRR
jgi:hypothetical protein